MQKHMDTRQLTLAAVVAALYVVMSWYANIFGIAFAGVQCRFSEALCVLPFFFPATTPGLFVGCLIFNLISPYGPLDVVFGSLATLLAAWLTSRMPNRGLAPLPPVICNALIPSAVIAWTMTGNFGPGFWTAYAMNAVSIGLGEAVACYGLGSLLLYGLPHIPFFRQMIRRELPHTA